MPALLTTMSTAPNSRMTLCIIAAIDSGFAISAAPYTTATLYSEARRVRSCSISLAGPKPLSTMLAPSAANRFAMPRPMPDVEPVTSAVLPFNMLAPSLMGFQSGGRPAAYSKTRKGPEAPFVDAVTGADRPSPLVAADNRTVDHQVRGAERCAAGTRDGALLGKILHLAEVGLAHVLAGGHRLRAPLRRVHVPERAVAALARVPEQHVQRVEAVEERRVEPLPLRVVRAGLAVHERGQRRARRIGAVAARERRGGKRGRPGRVLERRNSRIGSVGRHVLHAAPALETVRFPVADRAAREVDRDHLVGLSRSVGEVRRVEDDAVRQLDERTVALLADRARIGREGRKAGRPGDDVAREREIDAGGEVDHPVHYPHFLHRRGVARVGELLGLVDPAAGRLVAVGGRSEEHTSELQSPYV